MIDIDCKHFGISNILRLCANSFTLRKIVFFQVKLRRAFHARYKSPFFRLNYIVFLYQFTSHHNRISPTYHLQNEIEFIQHKNKTKFQVIGIPGTSQNFICNFQFFSKTFLETFLFGIDFIFKVFETILVFVICS